jgi:hypothetical protein
MSKEKLQAFAEAVSRSEELQKRLLKSRWKTARLTAEKIAKLSENAGTPFTAEEYLKSVAESSEEMSAEQLQSVAGGASPDTVDKTPYARDWVSAQGVCFGFRGGFLCA